MLRGTRPKGEKPLIGSYRGVRVRTRVDWSAYALTTDEAWDADLEAARAACPDRLDFAKLLKEAERHLA